MFDTKCGRGGEQWVASGQHERNGGDDKIYAKRLNKARLVSAIKPYVVFGELSNNLIKELTFL
jgi:hypothetical protein